METRLATIIVVLIVAASVVAGLIVGAQRDERTEPVDLVVLNGRVFTGAGQPVAEAVAVRGNEILRVGTNREIKRLVRRTTLTIDAHGGTVLPGFTDAHVHFVSGGLAMDRVNLLDAETLEAIQKKIGEFAAANPDRAWVLGRGWYYSPFPGGLPTRQQLDALVPDRPAYMTCYDGHTGWANTRALQLAGITAKTPDPPGGVVVKDAKTGEPTGVLKESAKGLMSKVLPQPTRDDRLRAIRNAVSEASRFGITSVHEAGTDAEGLEQFDEVRRAGDLKVRIYAALDVTEKMTEADADRFGALRQAYAANPLLNVGAVKIFADGVIEAHTAAMLAPYSNKPTTGHADYSPEELARIVSLMDRRGWQVLTHAIGDGAVRMTLDAYEKAAQVNPAPARGRRHRVEHAETIDPADIPRFGPLNVIVSYMPFHANPSPAQLDVWTANIGPERSARGWISKTLQDAGARQVFGSDWPVVALDPRLEINMAVTRRTPEGQPKDGWLPEQKISLETAIEAMTSAGAYASFEERKKGRLAPGLVADIVILSKDVFAQPSGRFLDAVVDVTIFDGKVVYARK
ncbi:MAG: amidohydrolase [Acidobacteria bacterium]|nr:amidohydrolase [Acidobacteriota bacterium]